MIGACGLGLGLVRDLKKGDLARGCLSGQVVVGASGSTGHQAGVEMDWAPGGCRV